MWEKVIKRRGDGKSVREREEVIFGEEGGLHQEATWHSAG